MNKKTKALTTEQYAEIIKTMREGTVSCRPNDRVATALVLEGNLGLRISDILNLRLADIVHDGDRYRLEITEQKTGKQRVFTVPLVIQQYIENYCLRHAIKPTERIFSLPLSVMFLDMRASAHTASGSGMPPRFIKVMVIAFCGAQRTPMRFGADAMRSITDTPKRSILLFNFSAESLLCSASLPA